MVNTLNTRLLLVRDLDYETLSRSGIVSEEELEKQRKRLQQDTYFAGNDLRLL